MDNYDKKEMANLIDLTDSTLYENTFCFENEYFCGEQINLPFLNGKLGILNFTAVNTSETTKNLDFIFTVDCSASMSNNCSDNKTKMQHIIHTLKNMIQFLNYYSSINVNITINAFNNKIYQIVKRVKITDYNLNNLVEKINKIIPKGITNIENALKKTSKYIQELKTLYPDNEINHIFMTDGEANSGSKDENALKLLVVDDIMNAFIGFGIHHDSALLNSLGSVNKSSYYFIDKIEHAGFVYGEILHAIIYKVLIDCEIQLTNGLIYDFKTNEWVSNLKIGDIVSEAKKTYNIISKTPDEISVKIQGTMDGLIVLYPSKRVQNTDISKNIFRLRTLQLMYEANNYCNKKRFREMNDHLSCVIHTNETENIDYLKEQEYLLKRKFTSFIEEMKTFMSENKLTDNKFMKNLCDDIYICYRTFNTTHGNMFCLARQTSQGSQRQYTVSNTYDLTNEDTTDIFNEHSLRPSMYRRQTNINSNFVFEDINVDDGLPNIQHDVSNINDVPYLTPQATQVMRFISKTIDDDQTYTEKI